MIFERRGEPGAEQLLVRHDGAHWSVGDLDPLEAISPAGQIELTRRLAAGALDRVEAENLRLGSPVPAIGKLISVGLNYMDHARETRLPIPEEPVYFLKAPETVVGPEDDIVLPPDAVSLDWEVELAVVIGTDANRLASPADAAGVIAGYTISHDVAERSWQIDPPNGWDRSKVTPTFNPLGPALVSPDEAGDVDSLWLRTWVNEVLRQDGTTADMTFPPAFLVWHLSQLTVLHAGDVISTGTPAGVAYGHPDVPFLGVGDVVRLGIEGLGEIRNTVVTQGH